MMCFLGLVFWDKIFLAKVHSSDWSFENEVAYRFIVYKLFVEKIHFFYQLDCYGFNLQ